ncbi:MAG: amino acid ABC transporter ATP-binding protein [Oscillospiraceae bacterium]|nr:amino acid ABC transporter ATP-binding protein [Oscillospiraceae bacterium]
MAVLEITNLKKQYDGYVVLDDISFSVLKGETVAVIGPSGAGKSTMLRCLINLETSDGGDICIDGEYLLQGGVYVNDKQAKSVCSKMGMVFQSFNLFPHMNVMKNLISAPINAKKMTKAEAIEKAEELLKVVGLSQKANSYPSELSGGEKQRVAIARALMMNPEVLLFDEPTSSLDPQLTGEVLGVMKKLALQKMTMIVVTHEMRFAREVADKVLFMANNKIIEQGTAEEIFENPKNGITKSFIRSIL